MQEQKPEPTVLCTVTLRSAIYAKHFITIDWIDKFKPVPQGHQYA